LNQRRSSGTLQTLREQLPWPEGRPFRILSIDGGGIRGILPASILTELEQRFLKGDSIGNHFDMIAGTSTGGIIALGLSMGLPASTILELYVEHGAEVFPELKWDLLSLRSGWRSVRGLRHHTFSPAPLKTHLDKIFEKRILGQAVRRLCVPSFDGFTEVNVFKTPHHRDYKKDWREEFVTVAMATAAAPTFFPVYKDRGRFFADGGVWANNPVMIALVDALVCYQLQRRQVFILSLGSGDSEIRITKNQILKGGLWHWRDVISSAMHLQSQNANGQAGLLIGRDQLIRLNAPAMPESSIRMDDYARSNSELPLIAKRLVDEHGDLIRERFLYNPTEEYPAFYGPRALETGKEDLIR
jgi:patatin-like phospholipase/acyl hydrolase